MPIKTNALRTLVFCLFLCSTVCCQGDRERTAKRAGDDGAVSETGNAASDKVNADSTTAGNVEEKAGVRSGIPSSGGSGVSLIRLVFTSEIRSKSSGWNDFAAVMLVTGPGGERTGDDSATGDSYTEIPNSSSYDEGIEDPAEEGAGAAWKVIEVSAPAAGRYTINVQGLSLGDYDLSVVKYDERMNSSRREFINIPIQVGAVHSYGLSIGEAPGAPAWVGGAYDGGGNEPAHADRLLSYATVTEGSTALGRGTERVGLLILYAESVMPETFRASLNDADVEGLFSPAAGGGEMVYFTDLQRKNTLLLSIEAGLPESDKTVTDADTLVFEITEGVPEE